MRTEKKKKKNVCFHEPLFCSVRSYGMCTQVSELLTSVNCQRETPIKFTILWSTWQNSYVWSISPCWVLLAYLNMKRCIQRLVWWYQKAEVQTVLCLWKCRCCRNTKMSVWCHHGVMVIKRAHDLFQSWNYFFFFWFCSCWMKFLLIVVEGESMYNYCSWIHSHSEMYCFIIVAGTCTFFWSMHFFMIQGMGF